MLSFSSMSTAISGLTCSTFLALPVLPLQTHEGIKDNILSFACLYSLSFACLSIFRTASISSLCFLPVLIALYKELIFNTLCRSIMLTLVLSKKSGVILCTCFSSLVTSLVIASSLAAGAALVVPAGCVAGVTGWLSSCVSSSIIAFITSLAMS